MKGGEKKKLYKSFFLLVYQIMSTKGKDHLSQLGGIECLNPTLTHFCWRLLCTITGSKLDGAGDYRLWTLQKALAWGYNLAGWKPHAEFLASTSDWCETPACTASDFGHGIMWTSQWSLSRIATGARYEGDLEKAEKNVCPALRVVFFFFWWIFLSLLFFLSSPAFLGKPSPHVGVRITVHLCLCEDKFML